MIALDIFTDGFFAAVAGIGFGAISDPPLRAFKMIALLAALGHACRFCLMTYLGVDIATASFRQALYLLLISHQPHIRPKAGELRLLLRILY